jgi:hypothetical protein
MKTLDMKTLVAQKTLVANACMLSTKISLLLYCDDLQDH